MSTKGIVKEPRRTFDEVMDVAHKVLDSFEDVYGEGESRGACHAIARNIHYHVPNSKVVAGYVRMRQGDAQHWWVVLEGGTIIDPLAEKWMDKPYQHIQVKEDVMNTSCERIQVREDD